VSPIRAGALPVRRSGASNRTPSGRVIPGGIQPCARSVTSTVVPSVLSPTAHLSPGSWRTTNARIRCNRSWSDSGRTRFDSSRRRLWDVRTGRDVWLRPPADAVADWGPMPRSGCLRLVLFGDGGQDLGLGEVDSSKIVGAIRAPARRGHLGRHVRKSRTADSTRRIARARASSMTRASSACRAESAIPARRMILSSSLAELAIRCRSPLRYSASLAFSALIADSSAGQSPPITKGCNRWES